MSSVSRRVALCVAVLCGCVLGVGVASAWAGEVYKFEKSLETPLTGFNILNGLGVGPSGEVFVANVGSNIVDVYEPTRSPEVVAEFRVENATNVYQLALDDSATSPSKGDVYIANLGGTVEKYEYKSGKATFLESIKAGGLVEPTAVAVNGDGDVFVADFHHGEVGLGFVNEYGPHGEVLVEHLITGLTEPESIAVDSTGNIYVAGEGGVFKYNTKGECLPLGTCSTFGGLTTHVDGVAVDPKGRVYLTTENSEAFVYESDGIFLGGLGRVYSTARGLGFSSSGSEFYISVQSGEIDAYKFEEGPSPEAPETGEATPNGSTAVLHGTLNPKATGTVGWYFEYNDNGSCTGGRSTPREPEVKGQGLDETAEVSGLEPSTTYAYCMISYNKYKYGSEYGATKTFTTTVSQPVVEQESVSGTSTIGTTLEARVNPEKQETTCLRFEYGETSAYGHSVSCSEASLGSGYGGVQATAVVSNLKPNTAYHFRVVVENPSSPSGGTLGSDETFQTSPLIAGESFSKAGQHGATVSAELNTGGLATSYYVEYGSTSAYGSSTPVRVTGEGEGTVSVSARIEALQSYSEYHFRVVASNSEGAEERGEDLAFRTLPAPINGLPDERVYEMVNPPDDLNMDVYRPPADYGFSNNEGFQTEYPFQVAVDGSAIAYLGGATVGGTGKEGYGIQYLATRSAGGGWSQKTIEPDGREDVYSGFDSDLDVGVLGTGVEQELSSLSALVPDKSYGMLYSCTDLSSVCRTPEEASRVDANEYSPLFTVKPPNRTGYAFGTDSEEVHGAAGADGFPVFAGGSAGFTSLLFEANDALIPGEGSIERELAEDVKLEVANGEDHSYLYDSVGGKLVLIDVLPGTTSVPEGTVATHAMFGAAPFNHPERNASDFSNVISGDGDRVYWTELGSGSTEGRVFLRENPGAPVSPVDSQGHCLVATDACTLPVSAGPARYWTSVEDGRLAFYTENGALYRFDAVTGVSEALTATTASVLGVTGVSENGEVAYFVAEEAIGAVHGPGGTVPQQGEPNMYVSDHGTIGFVATLAGTDGNEVEPVKDGTGADYYAEVGDWQPGLGFRTAEVTPDGGGLLFMSSEKLKTVGFPDGVPNRGLQEVYMFQAGSDELFCVSCSPSGETPPASEGGEEGYGPPAAAFVSVTRSSTYMFQWVSDDGDQVFFDSVVPLVPQDTNGKQDVYEWEREGSGSCVTGSGANGGCLYLLSSGSSKQASWLLGTSANGENVFITTRSKLTSNDGDEAYNLFDVRAHGERPIEEGVCTGTGCQGAPAPPPTFATPPSVTFEGVGNFPPLTVSVKSGKSTKKTVVKCRKPKVRRDGRCVTAKHKSKAKGKARRSRVSHSVLERHRRAA